MRVKTGNKDKKILEAAIKVFAVDGYHDSQISKIAEIAGIATGSIYLYYKNKEDILIKIIEGTWEKIYSNLKSIYSLKDKTAKEKYDLMIDAVFEVFTSDRDLAAVLVNDQDVVIKTVRERYANFYDKVLDVGENIIKEGIKNGEFNKETNLKALRLFIFGALRYTIREWLHNPKKYKVPELKTALKNIIKNGILAR